MSSAVFLDRDNTLIANEGDLGEPERVRLLDGVAEGLKRLRDAGFRLVVVTNQGGVARGAFTEDDVDSVHQRIATLVDEAAAGHELVSRFYYCPYHPKATIEAYRRDHPWRKPRPGMLLQAARDLNLDLAQSWMIGDAARDVQAGRSAGCRTVLVSRERRVIDSAKPTAAVTTFAEAVETILHRRAAANGAADSGAEAERKAAAQASAPKTSAPKASAKTTAAETAATEATAAETSTTEPTSAGTAAPTVPRDAEVTPVPLPSAAPAPGSDAAAARADVGRADLKRAVNELTEEIRADRMRRSEFTALRLTAGMCLLLALLLALLGIVQIDTTEVFMKWMTGAALVLLLANAILLLDLKG